MTINILGTDIAKNIFQLHGAGSAGNSGSQTLCITSSGSTGPSGESLVFWRIAFIEFPNIIRAEYMKSCCWKGAYTPG
jgi:hypothetical protein